VNHNNFNFFKKAKSYILGFEMQEIRRRTQVKIKFLLNSFLQLSFQKSQELYFGL
jgi:hypothetical protein